MNEVTLGSFNYTDVKVIVDESGNVWLARKQIEEVLGYDDTVKVRKIHHVLVEEGVLRRGQLDRRSEECMFAELAPPGGFFVYNPPAVAEICIESNKPRAKSFRRWFAKQVRATTRKKSLLERWVLGCRLYQPQKL